MSRFIVILGLTLLFMGVASPAFVYADEGFVPEHPNILVGTSEVNVKVHLKGELAGSSPLTVMFRNAGNATLRWQLYTGSNFAGCTIAATATWLRIAPDAGYLSPRFGTEVRIFVDYPQLGVGVHDGILCLASNDPDTPLVQIPLHIVVE